jgi:hypothetical protein
VVCRAGRVDEAATRARREALRAARPRVRLVGAGGLEADRGRLVRLDSETAARLGVAVGAIVELVNPRGAPLRAWVADVMPGNGGRAEISPNALGMLALADGAEVELRALHSGSLGPATHAAGDGPR